LYVFLHRFYTTLLCYTVMCAIVWTGRKSYTFQSSVWQVDHCWIWDNWNSGSQEAWADTSGCCTYDWQDRTHV